MEPPPRAEKWSLTERRGALRLHAFQPLRPADFWAVRNVVSQRSWRTVANEAIAEFDLAGMVDGQHAGLVHFGRTYASLGVVQAGGVRRIELNENGKLTTGPEVRQPKAWVRSVWGADGKSEFAYSFDGKSFTTMDEPYPLTWGRYRGDRIGAYTYNDGAEGGYVDLASFRYTIRRAAQAPSRPKQ